MIIGNHIIEKNDEGGISIYEVSKILGNIPLDLGKVCTSDNINVFARYKPVRNISKVITKEKTPRFYRSSENNCGLPLVRWGSEVLQLSDTSLSNWITNTMPSEFCSWSDTPKIHPRGVAGSYNEPYRLRDFDGYDHTAGCPIEGTSFVDEISFDTAYHKCNDINVYLNGNYDDTNLKLTVADISAYFTESISGQSNPNGCLGVLMYVSSKNADWKSSMKLISKPVGSGAPGLDIALGDMKSPGGTTKLQATDKITFIPVITNINTQAYTSDANGVDATTHIIDTHAFANLQCIPYPLEAGTPKTITVKQITSKFMYIYITAPEESIPIGAGAQIPITVRLAIPSNYVEKWSYLHGDPTIASYYPDLYIKHTYKNWDTGDDSEVSVQVWNYDDLQSMTVTYDETNKYYYLEKTINFTARKFFTGSKYMPYTYPYDLTFDKLDRWSYNDETIYKGVASVRLTK